MKKLSNKIVFFGNEKLATGITDVQPVIRRALEANGFEIEKVVTGPLSERGNHQAELAVLAAYGHIIPQNVLNEFPLGIINVHPSLLPLYRGPTPIEQAILDGAKKTGVSIMRLTAGMDEGPIYKQKTVHLTGKESKQELAEQLQRLGSKLLVEVLPAIVNGSLKPRSQPHPNRATYSHKLSKEHGVIDWTKPAQQIEREIRAFAGWPKSRTTIANKEVIITKARLLSKTSGKAGTIDTTNKELIVMCGEGALAIERLQPAGKKEMSSNEFLAGYSRYL